MDDMRAAAIGFPLPSRQGAGEAAQAVRASAAISLA
jgi:hypothetical protein